jgi:hypothetical protein
METDDKKNGHDPEWEDRVLCPDGNCIGVIGPEGRCKECGMIYGNPSQREQKATETVFVPESGTPQDPEPVSDWENRRLCPDGNCIGIIGPDGRCGECGKEG